MRGIALRIRSFFTQGHERTLKARKNIAASFLLRLISMSATFILVPITINYIDPTQYGIWLTLSSIVSWMGFFDIGLGNGLRNKLTEAVAFGHKNKARVYVSTTYILLASLSVILFLLFLVINHFLDWRVILNTIMFKDQELNRLVLVIMLMFSIQFTLQNINTVLTANHDIATVSAIGVIGQISMLFSVYLLTIYTHGSLLKLIFIFMGIPIVIQLFFSIWFYSTKYKAIAPSFKYINFRYGKDLFKVGGVFFLIQMGALILFQTDNIVIIQIFGPEEVTTFNIAYKLFSTVTIGFGIIMAPLWSAFTDAYAKNDYTWMLQIITKIRKYWLYLSMLTFIIVIISPFIYRFWVPRINIPFTLSLSMGIYTISYMWVMLHCFFLNGVGKLYLQLYSYIIIIIVNIPSAILLSKIIGISGVPVSNIIVLIGMGYLVFVQTNKILNKSADGIWNK